jgi:hypothetical protein
VRDGRSELDDHTVGFIVNSDVLKVDHTELFQRIRVLGIHDVPDQIKHLPCIERVRHLVRAG